MKDEDKTKEQLINDLAELRQRVAELEASETERKRAEEELRESGERLRSLFETMAEGVVLIAPDGQIVQANPAAERILGLERSEIEGRNYVGLEWEILRPDGTPMPAEEMAGPRAMKEKHPVKDVVMGVKRLNGFISWINVNATPLINEAGELEGVVGTFVDITERRRAEEELRESEERYRSLVERARDIIYTVSLEGTLASLNPAFETITGWSRTEWIGKPLQSVVHPDDWPLAVEMFQRMMRGETPPVHEVRVRLKSGGYFSGEFMITPHIQEGKVVGVLGIGRDITERKRAERERERLILELQDAFAKVRTLSGLLPICASCKKIRDDQGYWNRLETYIQEHSEAEFSYGICPECAKRLYPELFEDEESEG